MPRVQINLTGTSTRTAATWTITTQWAVASLPTVAALTTALTSARAALAASADFKLSIASNYSFVSLKGLGYTVPTGPADYTTEVGGAAVAGTGNGLAIPLAVVISEQTGAAGGSYRGRSYWPAGATTDAFLNGSVSAATQTNARAGWLAMHSALLTALATLGGSPVHVVFSRKTGAMTPITVIRTGNRVDTARGRFGDTPEVYTAGAVPGVLLVGPEDIGLPPDALPEDVQAVLDAINSGKWAGDITLGPLKEAANYARTILQAREE